LPLLRRRISKGPRVWPSSTSSTPWGRFKTYLHYLWNDHAYLRVGFSNAHWISPELVRANQPWPFQLAWWKKQGIKTIVNLRGGFDGSFYALEKDACERLGLNHGRLHHHLARGPNPRAGAGRQGAVRAIEYPALMHCKSGADRAGS
jgi:protein tyrosine/serine phosphatase